MGRVFACYSTKKQAERAFKEIIQSYRNGDKEYKIPKDENETIKIFQKGGETNEKKKTR